MLLFYKIIEVLNFIAVIKEPYPARSTYQVAKLPLVSYANI